MSASQIAAIGLVVIVIGALTADVSRANSVREIEFVDGRKAPHPAACQTAMHTDLFSV